MIRVPLMLRCALVSGIASLAEISFAEDFLVRQDGSSLTQEVHDGDPKSYDVLYWEIHFRSKYGNERSDGVLIDKTYDGLMREVKVMQKCDLFYAHAMHVDVDSFDNYLHPGPPIAVLKKPETTKSNLRVAAKVVQKIRDLDSRYQQAVEAWNVMAGNWEKIEVKEGGAIENVGKVIGEYTDNFRDVFKKLTRLKGYVNESNDIAGLENALGSFDSSLSETEASAKKATDALAGVSEESGAQSATESADPGGSDDMQNAIAVYISSIKLTKEAIASRRSRGESTALLEKKLQQTMKFLEEAKAEQRRHDALQQSQ